MTLSSTSKNCEYCQAAFFPNQRTAARQRFCSTKCKYNWKNLQPGTYKRICGHCKEEFLSKNITLERDKYCSVSCGLSGSTSKIEKVVICTICDESFIFNGRGRRTYCTECYRHLRAQRAYDKAVTTGKIKNPGVGSGGDQFGEKNHKWDPSAQHGKYKSGYRAVCFEHWPRLCVMCKLPRDDCFLDVHHIDGNPFNDDPMNLIPLCRICHCQVHSKRPSNPVRKKEYLEKRLFTLWKEGSEQLVSLASKLTKLADLKLRNEARNSSAEDNSNRSTDVTVSTGAEHSG